MKVILSLIFGLVFSAVVIASPNSHYSGQQTREIKSLSKKETDGYINGKGMGFSKVAELNHFPGPRHVLDLTEDLKLTREQFEETNNIYKLMRLSARKYGRNLVEKEREIDDLFSTQQADSIQLERLVKESAEIKAKIRLIHLKAHVSQK